MKRLILLGSIVLGGLAGCTNPEVPAGHEGYVYYTPLIFGQMEFRDSLPGPATTGVSWRLSTINIDMRARSYKEDFQLLTKENLTVSFEVNTRIRLRPGTVQVIVEDWGAANWYEWNVKERLRTIVREQVTEFSAAALQVDTHVVKAHIEEKLKEELGKAVDPTSKVQVSPIMIESLDIGEIHFPKEVEEAINSKLATRQELERQLFVLAQTEQEANTKILHAIAEAKKQLTISSTLDPLYVQYRAIQAYRQLAKAENSVTMVLPNSSDGTALPLILQPKTRRVFNVADKKKINDELDQLESDLKDAVGAPPRPVEEIEAAVDAAVEAVDMDDEADPEEAPEAETPAASPPAAPAP